MVAGDPQERRGRGDAVAIVGATLIDGTGAPPVADATVLVRGDSIEAAGPSPAIDVPPDAEILQARGKWLIPGLIDAHAHAGPPWTLTALLAMGITTIRKPGPSGPDDPDGSVGSDPSDAAPEMIRAGAPIDFPPGVFGYSVCVDSDAAMKAAVAAQAAAGVDIIKLYVRLPPELVAAGVREAHACGLKAMGDLRATSWTDAARAGIDYLAHAVPRHPSLLPAATRESFVSDVRAGRVNGHCRWMELVDLEGAEIEELIDALLEHQVVVDPTLATFEAMFFETDVAFQRTMLPSCWLLPESLHGILALRTSPRAEDRALLTRYRGAWQKMLDFVGLLFDRGVTLLAGTDTPRPWVVPGASLHRELALLVAAGLSPSEALCAATGRSAAALGLGADRGTVEAGKRADLVLLGRDPLADINHSSCIEWVMKAGRRHAPEDLRGRYE